jgi:hypothetical protein
MPEGPVSKQVETPSQQTNPSQPQDVASQPFSAPMGLVPAPTNQSTTKPRQMPGDSGSGGPGLDPSGGDGAEGGEGDSSAPAGDSGPSVSPVQARRKIALRVMQVMDDIVASNPALPQHEAYTLAKTTVEQFGLVREAWNALDYGDRGPVPDSDLTVQLKNIRPGRAVDRLLNQTPVERMPPRPGQTPGEEAAGGLPTGPQDTPHGVPAGGVEHAVGEGLEHGHPFGLKAPLNLPKGPLLEEAAGAAARALPLLMV